MQSCTAELKLSTLPNNIHYEAYATFSLLLVSFPFAASC